MLVLCWYQLWDGLRLDLQGADFSLFHRIGMSLLYTEVINVWGHAFAALLQQFPSFLNSASSDVTPH
jgi:hypothetical protein